MWSGSLLTNFSGSITGAHQRIDRLAYKKIKQYDNKNLLPKLKDIIHFEGKNGPDGIKAKSPAQDEPWHYFNPSDLNDNDVISFIENHYKNLVKSLRERNSQKSAFEMAWLAHAIVDGLTPAHHYPYEQELEKLRGEPKQTRSSIKKKIIIPGSSKSEMIKNNWKMWGAKGLFTTHGTFELGVAMLLIGYKKSIIGNISDDKVVELGIAKYYRQKAIEIASWDLYSRYYKFGWSIKLSNEIKEKLLPLIMISVAEIWLTALNEAGLEFEK